ncbi:MAG: hypothetical protein AAB895_01045, partial [Patescibacteria group bacterium]
VVHLITKYPDKVYKNKLGKRGEYCLVKSIKNNNYLCSIEVVQGESESQLEIVTFFRVNDDNYLKNYDLLWEWKGGDLHRNAFDSDLTRPNSIPQ